jgi:hypothetical protein
MKKIKLEYIIESTQKNLFYKVSTPAGLQDWFADKVITKDENYSIFWYKTEYLAKIIRKNEEVVEIFWLNDVEKSPLTMSIKKSVITNDVILTIIDFYDDNQDEIIDFWDAKIKKLKNSLGVRL